MGTLTPVTVRPIPAAKLSDNLNSETLAAYLGKSVEDFCGKYGKVGDGMHHRNHCAHFVSHALSLRIPGAALCSNVAGTSYPYAERMLGYCIRVDQVFNSCENRSLTTAEAAMRADKCILVTTIGGNVEDKAAVKIGTNPRKHIGVLMNGRVYNYSNAKSKVVTLSVVEFSRIYGSKATVLLKADLP